MDWKVIAALAVFVVCGAIMYGAGAVIGRILIAVFRVFANLVPWKRVDEEEGEETKYAEPK